MRRSLLDLHRKSVENLAAAAAACVPDAQVKMNILKSAAATAGASGDGTGGTKSKRFALAAMLRPPKLNLQRKSLNVASDSTQSVKESEESPV